MFPGFWSRWKGALDRPFADRTPEAGCYEADVLGTPDRRREQRGEQ